MFSKEAQIQNYKLKAAAHYFKAIGFPSGSKERQVEEFKAKHCEEVIKILQSK